MFVKVFAIFAPLVGGAIWAMGGFGGVYSRDVARPPAEVIAAIADLDITGQPGSPGTDPEASGGVAPVFQVEQAGDRVVWTVMSGDKVATRMTAFVQPLDGGKASRVTVDVERGDAPDDFVSPAFRSEGLTLGLFSMALEGELDQLVAPARLSREECQELEVRLLQASGAGTDGDPASLGQAVGGTAKNMLRLNAVEGELKRRGCDTSGGGTFEPVSDQMSEGLAAAQDGSGHEVNLEPGKPMLDLNHDGR
jgi:hypothetical protein